MSSNRDRHDSVTSISIPIPKSPASAIALTGVMWCEPIFGQQETKNGLSAYIDIDDFFVIERHAVGCATGMWRVSLNCRMPVTEFFDILRPSTNAVIDDFGNLVRVS